MVRKAPFDAPEYKIPTGHRGDNICAVDFNPAGDGMADTTLMRIPQVGKYGGRSTALFLGIGNNSKQHTANPVAGGVCSPNFNQP